LGATANITKKLLPACFPVFDKNRSQFRRAARRGVFLTLEIRQQGTERKGRFFDASRDWWTVAAEEGEGSRSFPFPWVVL
jgi:hypothetical protein